MTSKIPTDATPQPRTGSPGPHASYSSKPANAAQTKTNSLAPSSIASQSARSRSASHAPQNPSSSSSSSSKTSPSSKDDGGAFVIYSATHRKPSQAAQSASSSSVLTSKEPIKETEGSFFRPYSVNVLKQPTASAITPSSSSLFTPTKEQRTSSPYQQWTPLNLNSQTNATGLSESIRQVSSPVKYVKPKIVQSDSQDGTATPPHSIQFMSLESPAKPRTDRSPSPSPTPQAEPKNGRMSRGGFIHSPSSLASSPSSTPVPSEVLSPTSPTATLVSSASEIFTPTSPTATLIASASASAILSPTSSSTSPSSASSTPSPHEAAKKGYVSYSESTKSESSKLLPLPTRKLTEAEIRERQETVISGLQLGPRRANPAKDRPASASPVEKPVSPHEAAAKAPYVQWNNVPHGSSAATQTTNPNQK